MTGANYIDLSLRIRDDGGPTYSALASIGDAYARGDRVRQLIYLGLMAERGLIGVGTLPMAHLTAPASSSVASSERQRRDPSLANAEPPDDTLFNVDDLAAIFGGHLDGQVSALIEY